MSQPNPEPARRPLDYAAIAQLANALGLEEWEYVQIRDMEPPDLDHRLAVANYGEAVARRALAS